MTTSISVNRLTSWFRNRGLCWGLALLASTAFSQVGSAATVSTDRADYPPGSTVYLSGSGFAAGEAVQLQVLHVDASGVALAPTDPTDPAHQPWTVPADANGNIASTWFVCLTDCIGATLEVQATGMTSGAYAFTRFTDSPTGSGAANLDQIRNGPADVPLDPPAWVNGNAGQSTAHYIEGHSIAYRIVMTDLPVGQPVDLVLGYDIRHSGRNAIDYLTSYQRLEPHPFGHAAETVDPLLGLAGAPTTFSTFAIPAPGSVNSPKPGQPTASYNALASAEKLMRLYGGTITGMQYVSEGDLTQDNSETQIKVSFVPNSAMVVLTYGGHIASRLNWGYLPGGQPASAAGISGSPYHMSLLSWSIGGLGKQDRSLSASAVMSPECFVLGPTAVCAGSTATYTGTNTPGATITWELLNNSAGAAIVSTTPVENGSRISVSVANPGAYTVRGTASANNLSSTCDLPVTVNGAPTCGITGLDQACPGTTGLRYLGPEGMDTYEWQIEGNGRIVGPANAREIVVDAGAACARTFRLTLTVFKLGCDSTCQKTVTVNDTEPPVITECPGSVSVSTEPGKNSASVAFGPPVATDCTAVTFSYWIGQEEIASPHVFPLGTTTVNVIATDACGNESDCSFNVTVTDSEPPSIECPPNLVLECDKPVTPVVSASATDNSGGAIDITFEDAVTPGACPQERTIARTWTARDAAGNAASCVQTIAVRDTVAPTLAGVPGNQTVPCDAVPAPPTVTASDNCDPSPRVRYDQVRTDGTCADRYTLTRTWTATDACGNTASASQILTVHDTTAPSLAGVPTDVTVECDAVPAPASVTATDNCDSSPAVSFSEIRADGDCPSRYTLTRSWTATDRCGNTASRTQVITVQDATPPQIICPADAVVACDASSEPTHTGVASATDNCDPAVQISHTDIIETAANGIERKITRTWTATDACGNASSCVQIIQVDDSVPPVLTAPANLTVECDASVEPKDTGMARASDSCDAAVKITYQDAVTPGQCPQAKTITRHWTATDAAGNATSADQLITVVDTKAPVLSGVPGNVTVECDAVPTAATVTATDNCDSAPTVSYREERTNGDCPARYTLTRTWTAVDDCGNTASKSQTVTVQDTKAPVLSGVPGNVTVECDAVPTAATVTATDNCDSAPTVSYREERTNGDCPARYTLTRTWTAVDDCGNTASKSQTVTVQDTKAPVLSGVPANVTVDCNAVPAPATVTARDNCDSSPTVTFAEVRNNGTCADSYTLTRTWTGVDDCGNVIAQSQIVTVVDTKPPTVAWSPELLAQKIQPAYVILESGASTDPKDLYQPIATDACDSSVTLSYADQVTDGDCPQERMILRTWTGLDDCGNAATCPQTIWVRDTTPPILLNVPANQEVPCGQVPEPPANVTATDTADPAPVVTLNETKRPADPFNEGYIITRTWTATDACGNAVSASQEIHELPCDNWPDICGTKYYDANVNGQRDNGETGIAGWRITLINSAGLRIVTQTDAQGNYCIDHVPPDTYRVVEGAPVESSWHHSTPDSVNLDLRDPSFLETTVQVVFGNFCLGAGGGHTHGFWSNKNGEAQVMDRDSDPADQKEMSLLSRIALRETDGTHFDPPLYKTFRAWLRTGNAVNMARMLSVQLAAMELNVEAGFVNPDRLVYAPGCGKTGLNNDFITIGDLMDAADRALARNGLSPSGSADRQLQSCLMTALDNANNNLNFLQFKPCPFTFPTR